MVCRNPSHSTFNPNHREAELPGAQDRGGRRAQEAPGGKRREAEEGGGKERRGAATNATSLACLSGVCSFLLCVIMIVCLFV